MQPTCPVLPPIYPVWTACLLVHFSPVWLAFGLPFYIHGIEHKILCKYTIKL